MVSRNAIVIINDVLLSPAACEWMDGDGVRNRRTTRPGKNQKIVSFIFCRWQNETMQQQTTTLTTNNVILLLFSVHVFKLERLAVSHCHIDVTYRGRDHRGSRPTTVCSLVVRVFVICSRNIRRHTRG